MQNTIIKYNKLTIGLTDDEHQQVKRYAHLHGKTLNEYILESIRERLKQDEEERDLLAMTTQVAATLKELWNNDKDAIYDQI